MIFRNKDSEDSIFYRMHFSDWFVIIIAALLTAAAVYLLVTPEDFGAKLAKAAKVMTTPSEPQQQATPGETPAMIFKDDKKK